MGNIFQSVYSLLPIMFFSLYHPFAVELLNKDMANPANQFCESAIFYPSSVMLKLQVNKSKCSMVHFATVLSKWKAASPVNNMF